MYQHILVPLDRSAADPVVLAHVRKLARACGARLTLIHVADGHVARNLLKLDLAPSPEMVEDQRYLDEMKGALAGEGFAVEARLACGEPAKEILACAEALPCDLIAMGTHGHGMISDLILGSVAHEVRHQTDIPVLMIRAPKAARREPPAGG